MRFAPWLFSLAFVCGSAAAQESGLIIDNERTDRAAPGAELQPRLESARPGSIDTSGINVAPFVLQRVDVQGSSLPRSAFDARLSPLTGQSFDGARLSLIANAVAAAYAEGPIALYAVEIPEQDFSDGAVTVRVRQGHVSGVSITGETEDDVELVRHYAAGLAAERPLTRATMERQLSLISDIPGLETRVGMSAADTRGGVRLGLELDRTPWEYQLGFNNSGSDSLGETQLSATLIRNALFRLGDQTRLTVGADSEFEHFTFAGLTHRQPVGYSGASITGRFSTLTTEPEGGLRGRANAAGVTFSYPWLRSYRRNLTLGFGLDGLNSDSAELGGVVSEERTRVLRASAAFTDAQPRSAWMLSGSVSQGLDSLGASAGDPFTAIDFTKFNLQAVHNRGLSRAFFLRAAMSAQASDQTLPASERFTLGGAAFGRAFPAAHISGDSGYGASAELAWRVRRGWLSEVYAFADGGSTRLNAFSLDRDLSSAGAGVRLAFGETRIDLELAQPIEQPDPETEDLRFRFGVSAKL